MVLRSQCPLAVGQTLDDNVMGRPENIKRDFYLVNTSGNLIVSRGNSGTWSSGEREESIVLVTGLLDGKNIKIKNSNWLGPDRQPISVADASEILKRINKKN